VFALVIGQIKGFVFLALLGCEVSAPVAQNTHETLGKAKAKLQQLL